MIRMRKSPMIYVNYVWTDWFVVEAWIVSSNLHLIRMGKDGIQEFIITQADAQIERKFHSTGTWDNYYTDILYMDYEDGQTTLENVWISGRTFKCLYNGEWVTF